MNLSNVLLMFIISYSFGVSFVFNETINESIFNNCQYLIIDELETINYKQTLYMSIITSLLFSLAVVFTTLLCWIQ